MTFLEEEYISKQVHRFIYNHHIWINAEQGIKKFCVCIYDLTAKPDYTLLFNSDDVYEEGFNDYYSALAYGLKKAYKIVESR